MLNIYIYDSHHWPVIFKTVTNFVYNIIYIFYMQQLNITEIRVKEEEVLGIEIVCF